MAQLESSGAGGRAVGEGRWRAALEVSATMYLGKCTVKCRINGWKAESSAMRPHQEANKNGWRKGGRANCLQLL